MTDTQECSVRGCSDKREEWFTITVDGGGDFSWPVCAFHRQVLDAGESYTIDDDELLLGPDSPLQLLNFRVLETGFVTRQATLEFGRDGILEDTVVCTITPEMIRKLCHWLAPDGPHNIDGTE